MAVKMPAPLSAHWPEEPALRRSSGTTAATVAEAVSDSRSTVVDVADVDVDAVVGLGTMKHVRLNGSVAAAVVVRAGHRWKIWCSLLISYQVK